jgi:hypothetical protein
LAWNGNADLTTTISATYAGVAMTAITTPLTYYTDSDERYYLTGFYLSGAATGSNTLTITFNPQTGVCAGYAGGCIPVSGAGNPANPNTASANGTAAAVNVTSASGDLVIDICAYRANNNNWTTFSIGANQSSIWTAQRGDAADGRGDVESVSSYETATGSSTAMTWTLGAARDWGSLGFSLTPKAPGGNVMWWY